jgi:hypothetical protein
MMRGIRTRMALAATLPVLLVVLATASAFWQGRVRDLEDSHQQRVDLLARQVALFSAYGLFSGNSAACNPWCRTCSANPVSKPCWCLMPRAGRWP